MSLVSEDIQHLEITKCQHQQSSHRLAKLTQWALKSESKQINDKTSERGDRNSLLHMTATARNKEGCEQDVSLCLFLIQFFFQIVKIQNCYEIREEDRLIRYKSDGYFWNIDTNHSISNKSNFFLLLPSRLIIFLLLMSRLICSNLSSFFLAGSTASHHQQKTPTYLSETFPLSWTDHQTRSAILGERN